jgi:hypothetical protein
MGAASRAPSIAAETGKESGHGVGAPEADEELGAAGVDLGADVGVAFDIAGVLADEAVKGAADVLRILVRSKARLKSGHDPDIP